MLAKGSQENLYRPKAIKKAFDLLWFYREGLTLRPFLFFPVDPPFLIPGLTQFRQEAFSMKGNLGQISGFSLN
jgi:hypothetical protein